MLLFKIEHYYRAKKQVEVDSISKYSAFLYYSHKKRYHFVSSKSYLISIISSYDKQDLQKFLVQCLELFHQNQKNHYVVMR